MMSVDIIYQKLSINSKKEIEQLEEFKRKKQNISNRQIIMKGLEALNKTR